MIWGVVTSLNPAKLVAIKSRKEYLIEKLPKHFDCGYLHAGNRYVLFEIKKGKATHVHVPPRRLISFKASAVYYFDYLKRNDIKKVISKHLTKAERAIYQELNALSHAVTFNVTVGRSTPATSHYPIKYSMRFHPDVIKQLVSRISYLSKTEKKLEARIKELREERLAKTEFLEETNRLKEGFSRTKSASTPQ